MAREIVRFEPNVPVEVALQFPNGKMVPSNYGSGEQAMYSLEGNRVMYLDLVPSFKVTQLGVKPGETFFICLKWTGKRTAPKEWDVWLSPATEKRRAQEEMPLDPPDRPISEIEQKLRDSILLAETRKKEQARATAADTARSQRQQPRSTGTYGPQPTPAPAVRTMPSSQPRVKQAYGEAARDFLILAGRASSAAEKLLAQEGATIRFDSRDIAALATTMFIQAAKEGSVVWTPGAEV